MLNVVTLASSAWSLGCRVGAEELLPDSLIRTNEAAENQKKRRAAHPNSFSVELWESGGKRDGERRGEGEPTAGTLSNPVRLRSARSRCRRRCPQNPLRPLRSVPTLWEAEEGALERERLQNESSICRERAPAPEMQPPTVPSKDLGQAG